MIKSLTPEEIEKNWLKFRALCNKLGDRTEPVNKMLDFFEERLALCPASGRTEFHNAFAGGLVEHSLRVLQNAHTICKTFNYDIKSESLIIAALFHDLGKVGDEEQPYYVEQTSDWHRDKLGEMYKHNDKIQYMTVGFRGVFLMQRFGIKLDAAENLSILLNDGWVLPENKAYCLKEPMLVTVIQMADYLATKQEKPKHI